MADYSSYKPSTGSTGYPADINSHIDATEAIATEVENARGSVESTLVAHLNTFHYWRLFSAAIL